MSDKTTNKTEQPSPLCEAKEMSSLPGGAHLVSNPSSKAPLSVLSPYVPEFVPRSCALRRGITVSQATSAKDWVDGRSQDGATEKIGTLKDLPRKVEESDESNSRGWWEETPLMNKVNDKTPMNPSKADFTGKGLPKKTPKLQNENTLTCSWRQKLNNEEMNSNWRTRPTNQKQKNKNNELGFTRDKRKTWRKDPSQSNAPQNKERSSVQTPVEADNKLTGIKSRSGQEGRPQRGSEVKDGQLQQRSIRIGSGRGRGRIRTAWMNDMQNQDSSLHNNEPKDFEETSQENNALSTKRLGSGRGVESGTHSHVGCAANKQTLNTVDDLTRKNDCDSDISKRNDEEDYRSSVVEDDGWIVVGNKKKMDEHKDWASKTKEKRNNSDGKRLNKELKEIHQKDEKASLLDSHQKVVKKNRKRDEKDRTVDRTVQEKKMVQNKEVNLDQSISSKDLRKQIIKPTRMKKTPPEKERINSVESETKSSKNGQAPEQESKKVEVVKTIKTGQNSRQKEVKILLKKNDDTKVSHNEQTIIRDPEFELCKDDDEFPDLATANKSSNTSLASDWLCGGTRMPIISYSAVLKALPRPKAQPSKNISSDKSSSEIQEKIENDGDEGQGKKKKKKKKKKAKDNEVKAKQMPQEPKKTKQPMQFDLGDWLSTIEKIPPKISKDKQANPKKVVTIATGVLQIKVQDQPVTTSRTATVKSAHGLPHNEKTFHNILDSTAPVVKRGKEREVPKKKKPSQLKRIILREREEKRKVVKEEEKQDINTEHESLADEIHSSQEIRDTNKTDQKSSKDDSDITQSTDDVTSHHDGSTNVTSDDPSSDGDRPVAPSQDDVKAQIHSRRFREYCDNVMDKELNNTTLELLQKLVMFQDRQYHKDPVKSKAKRRYVVGLREVTKHLKLRKIKLVIISPNVERIKSAGGLDDALHNIISIAHQNGVPLVFALRRQVLGRVLHKKVPVSAIGVFYYDGAQDEYMKLMDLTEKAREVYAQRWKSAYDQLMKRIQKENAVEMSHDTQEESENPNEKMKETYEDPANDKDNIGELDNTTQVEEERKSKELEQEENGNQTDEIFDPSENSPEESENECDLDSFHSEKIEWNETNEIENECSNGDNPSIVQETDLAVEDL